MNHIEVDEVVRHKARVAASSVPDRARTRDQ